MYRRKAMGIVVLAVVFELSIAGAVDAWAEFCSASYTCSNGTSAQLCHQHRRDVRELLGRGRERVVHLDPGLSLGGWAGGCSQTYTTKYVCPHTTQGTE